MKKKIIILIIVAVIILLTPLWLMLFYVAKVGIKHQIFISENKVIKTQNRELNYEILQKYLKEKYGLAVYNTFKIEEIDKENEFSSNIYTIRAPFIKLFNVGISSETHEVYYDTFYEVLSRDEKFQHLYSEWVKKQIGCEDENLELEFSGVRKNILIDFQNIKSISKDYNELFSNVINYYFWIYKKTNISSLNDNNKKDIAREIINKYTEDIMKITGYPDDIKKDDRHGRIYLSSGNFDRKKDINFLFYFNHRNINDEELEEEKY